MPSCRCSRNHVSLRPYCAACCPLLLRASNGITPSLRYFDRDVSGLLKFFFMKMKVRVGQFSLSWCKHTEIVHVACAIPGACFLSTCWSLPRGGDG